MKPFRFFFIAISIFGKYPASVGSWFIDAHTLGYMYDKYHIIASCNCKDQIGTDGYTLWGGYRANLMWEGSSFRSRDIHLFDERFESDYLAKAGESTQCVYTTLHVVDGFMWSTRSEKAGLHIIDNDGNPLTFGVPDVSELSGNVLQTTFSDASGRKFNLTFYEYRLDIPNKLNYLCILILKKYDLL